MPFLPFLVKDKRSIRLLPLGPSPGTSSASRHRLFFFHDAKQRIKPSASVFTSSSWRKNVNPSLFPVEKKGWLPFFRLPSSGKDVHDCAPSPSLSFLLTKVREAYPMSFLFGGDFARTAAPGSLLFLSLKG